MTHIKRQAFTELSPFELYRMIQLRMASFVVEQKAIYQDLDNKDQQALHFSIYENSHIIGYLRFQSLDEISESYKFSRICVDQDHRKKAIGSQLITAAIDHARSLNARKIQIKAQKYLASYYQKFGFSVTSDIYVINEIQHQDMELTL